MIDSAEVRFPAARGETRRAFLATPRAPGSHSGVLVLHDLLGLNDDTQVIARRFAEAGYVALAPDLFDGSGPKPICIVRTLRAFARGEGKPFEDLESARRWLAQRTDVDGDRIGAAGFCMGGGFALLLGVRAPLGATGCFYGEVPTRTEALRGVCPVVGGFGEKDRQFDGGPRLQRYLDELGVPHDIVVYPGVGHSYMNRLPAWMDALGRHLPPLYAGYDEAAAEDSWRRMLGFFAKHLGGPPPVAG